MSRQALLLVVLLAVLVAVVVYQMRGSVPAVVPASSSNAAGTNQGRPASAADMLDVRLELLSSEPAPFEAPRRDPFRFRERRVAQVPRTPLPPPPPPPQPRASAKEAISSRIRLIGIVDFGGRRMAVFEEAGQIGRPPLRGFEGDIVAGQYRLLKVGENAVEMSYLDGSAPQPIPLSGR